VIDELLNKHAAFWRCENNEPLLHKIDFTGFKMKPYPIMSGQYLVNPTPIIASDIDVDRLLGLDKRLRKPVVGEMVNAIGPVYSEAWMESLIGCPILASAHSCTAKPCAIECEHAASQFSVDAAFNSDWSKAMDAVLTRAGSAAGDRMGVRQLHLRGIIDMLAAYLGEEQLCFSMYDCGKALKDLSEKFADLYIKVARRGLDLRRSWQGGFVSSWGLFAPGQLLDYQVDASNMLPVQIYEQYFLKLDEKIINDFEYSLVHVHTCGIHIVESLLKLDHLKAIEISLDRETGRTDISAIINAAKCIQDHGKALLIYGELNQKELTMFIRRLNQNGLAIFYWHPNKTTEEKM
jgi:hypothetical protein